MAQQPVELILFRQLAGYLSMPVFIVGPDESLAYYNEAAEPFVGRPFSQVGTIMLDDINTMFQVTDEQGVPVPPDQLPLTIAVREHRPVYTRLKGKGIDGVPHHIELTALPLQGQGGRWLGAAAIFWEASKP
jgi:hypothetical protein